MDLAANFPVWKDLTGEQRELLSGAAVLRRVPAGTMLHGAGAECLGLLVIRGGQLRAFIVSGEGREITLYRLFERDMCLFSAACALRSVQFEVSIQAEKDTELWVVPPTVFRRLMDASPAVANYTSELMASRLSEVLWRMEQILWRSFDRRLADFLLEESALEGTESLRLTHEKIAAHLGTAREVVTRMLRYFQGEGLVRLRRGGVELLDLAGLRALGAGSK